MGAMKKGPFPLHASLKEAEARRVLITNACTSLPTLLIALAPAHFHVCVRRGRRRHLARVAPLGGPSRLWLLLRYDHVEAAERAARDDAARLLLSRRRGQVPARVEVPTAGYRGVRDVHILRSAERAATRAVVGVRGVVLFFLRAPEMIKHLHPCNLGALGRPCSARVDHGLSARNHCAPRHLSCGGRGAPSRS